MYIKPRTLMIASLAIIMTAMSVPALAQSVGERGDRQLKRDRIDRQERRERPDRKRTQERQASKGAKVGQPAPDFRLKDASGKTHSLADYKGKVVVLQWISPVCPVCVRVSSTGVVSNMLKTIKGIDSDFVHLTIHSNAGAEIAKSAEYLKKYDIKASALDDTSGRVGRMYGAKTTPHMFVIDKKGILRYSGAIDDDQAGRKGSDATNYVVNAVQQIAANETVTPDMTKPYGCSVKYAKGGDRASRGERGDRAGRGERGRRGSRAAQMFSRLDTNEDGIIDAKELEAIPEDRRSGLLDRYDTNKDGKIDKKEIEAAGQRRGGDGQRGGRRGGRGGRGGDGGSGGEGGRGGRGGDGG